MTPNINIIGSGFSSLAASCYLANAGFNVNVFEKNLQPGGRARQLAVDGFKFDMGPTWYWMPDVFERFFQDFNKSSSEYYTLERLDPGYRVYFENADFLDIPANEQALYQLFDQEEPGSASKLKEFLKEAGYNYEVAIKDLVYKPGLSPLELITPKTIKKLTQFFSSVRSDVRKRFSNHKLISVLEFPVLFLGAKPQDTPAFYNFMNYADLVLGTWYPKGGMYSVAQSMHTLAESLGVKFHFGANVEKILVNQQKITGLKVNGEEIDSDIVLSGADYHHTEQLLETSLRSYSEKYWHNRTFAPSALLFYVGFDKKLENLRHHTLFFDKDFDVHARDIYDDPNWPDDPLFYASFPSMTDLNAAPKGMEAGIFLIPLPPGLHDDEKVREKQLDKIFTRLENLTGQSVRNHVTFKKSYCVSDFIKDYNSYKGNAYGMANTLRQTAFLRPGIKSKKVKSLYFTGQLTVPGPGVPPSLISGKIAAELITKELKLTSKHEVTL